MRAGALQATFLRHGGSAFLIDPASGMRLSYAETARRAGGLVNQLRRAGLNRGDRIAVTLPNGPGFAVFYIACLLGGYTAVPVSATLAQKDRDFILARARLSAHIVRSGSAEGKGASGSVPTLSFELEGELGFEEDSDAGVAAKLGAARADDLCSVHFTSGTTSLPKGVAHRADRLLGNADAFNRAFGIGPERRFVHVMPMDYMAGFLNTLLGALTAGAAVILAPQFSPASSLRFWDPIVAHGGDLIWMSPTMLATLLRIDRGREGIDYCRGKDIRIFSGTAPLPLKVRNDFAEKYDVDPIESYGLSELLLITANDGPHGRKDGSVGRPIPEVSIEVRSEQGDVLGSGVDGEIFVRTRFSSVGYLDMESGEPVPQTGEAFETGDVGHLDEDGYLFVTGRRKDLIIRGGFNVSPRRIEETLLRHPAVENAAVVGAPHDFYGEEIVAAIVPKPGHLLRIFEADLRSLCRRELASGSVPDRFVSFAEFPLTQIGKVQKNKVRDQIIGTRSS